MLWAAVLHDMWMLLFVEDVDSDDDDSDFVEVADKEGFEPTVPEHRREEYGLAATSTVTTASASWQERECQYDVEDPTCLVASMIKRRQLELTQAPT